MATIAVYSLKGGVGKTTIAVNLTWCSAALGGHRTLLWDLDPQAAASYIMGLNAQRAARKVFAKDVAPDRLVRHSAWSGLDVLPADISLRGLDGLFDKLGKKRRLAKLIDGLGGGYGRVVLDCPPGLTATSEQVMRAADIIVVPITPSPLSRRAFDEVKIHLAKVIKSSAEIMPVWSMVDRRRALHREVDGGWPFIPMASAVEQMAVQRAPLAALAARGPAQDAFASLWRAIDARLAR